MTAQKPALDTSAHIEDLFESLVAFRRELHADPELSFEEFRTTDRIVEALEKAGLEPQRLQDTGAYVDIGEGPFAIGLRADIDALPVTEVTGLEYASKNKGVAHACGHDVHTTVMLGVALVLHRLNQEGKLNARVRVIFQPAEEKMPGGAKKVIKQGIIDSLPRLAALHCEPRILAGRVGTRIGAITSASDTIRIRLHGRGGHTSRPHLTEDLVYAMAQIALGVPAVLSRRIDVRSAVSVVWGQISAGNAPNAIPAFGTLSGTMRCLDAGAWDQAGELLDQVIKQVAAPYNVEVEVDHIRGVPPVVNAESETALIEEAARQEIGGEAIELMPQSMGGEDFAWMTMRKPGVLMRLGTRRPGGPVYDLHQGDYNPDESAIKTGVAVMTRAALLAADEAAQKAQEQ
ncbi:amidohydrolase [Pseudoglutamicibacter albus]|uniref:amidohydrolase n=1 Tax=Pseudoglutamicibacter albus TaxID=98671 RepID=UPI000C76E989|nr:amidohydrolase [Pseudoglutamicibacter albus]PKY80322.1 amidohydrolase [Pseudoglutamicibacter albus]WIK84833.1 amidohydrolase [Pseudoglutamicibacter albus]